jgi:hypothetical protein
LREFGAASDASDIIVSVSNAVLTVAWQMRSTGSLTRFNALATTRICDRSTPMVVSKKLERYC